MQTRHLAVAAAVAFLAATPPVAAQDVAAQDVTGTWEIRYTVETPRGSMDRTVTVHLEQDGTALTGTAEMPAMGRGPAGGNRRGGGQSRTVEISDGSVAGAEVMFTLALGRGDRTFETTFAGQVDGDAMEGTVRDPRGGERPFTGTRKEG
jgi:uncharacterized protein YcfJ